MLHPHIAIVLAGVPILFWPLTLITAPLALGWCFYGWKRPGSITGGRGRGRFVVAGLLAAAQIVGWGFLFTNLWLKAGR